MKIPVEDISTAGLEIQFNGFSSDDLGQALSCMSLPPDVLVDPKIRGKVILKREYDDVLISGALEVKMAMRCSRCLRQFECYVPVNVELVARRLMDQGGQYNQDSELEHDEIPIHGEEIDLSELIAQEISLDIPMKPLCKDDCAGICPRCGGQIGAHGCLCCSETTVDPRWEKLVTLKPLL
ncbi:MAG: YceD family protein [Desulfomonilaceae bacterium]